MCSRSLRNLVCIFGLLLLPSLSSAQKNKTDSIALLYEKSEQDSSRVNAALWLGAERATKEPGESFRYYREALSISKKINFSKGIIKAQNGIGSLMNQQSKFDSAVLLHQLALRRAKTTRLQQEISDACQGLASSFMRKKELDSARYYANAAWAISSRLKNYDDQANIYNILGNIFLEENDSRHALIEFIRSAKVYDSVLHNQVKLSQELANIGNVEYVLEDYSKALEYSMKSEHIAEAANENEMLAYVLKLNGRIYRKKNMPEKALAEYRKAMRVYEKLNDKRSMSETFLGIGNVQFDQQNFTDAMKNYKATLRLAKLIHNNVLMSHAYSALGYSWYSLQDFKKSLRYMDSSRIMAKKANDPFLVMDALQVVSQIQKELHQYKESLDNYQSYATLKDSINEAETKRVSNEIEAKYQSSERKAQIQLLQKDSLVKEAELKRQRVIQISIGVMLFFVILIAFLLVNRSNAINKTRREIELERMRNTIARDLHDEVGSALSSIKIMSTLATETADGNSQSYIRRISEQSSKIMDSMADIVWSIHPDNDSSEMLFSKMKEFAAEILEAKNMAHHFVSEEQLFALSLTIDQRKNIFLIFKESINNAAKYSGGDNIYVDFLKKRDTFTMSIADNGKGFNPETSKGGNGLRNLHERANSISAILSIQSEINRGTVITLEVPLT